jgi:hypothetical protein
MYSLATIIAMNEEVTEKAIKKGKKPRIVRTTAVVDKMPPFPFPSIGNYEPDGWTPLDIWFVDKTGLGRAGEPALTVEAFKTVIKEFITKRPDERIGFAIIEEGEMQVHIQAFRKEG